MYLLTIRTVGLDYNGAPGNDIVNVGIYDTRIDAERVGMSETKDKLAIVYEVYEIEMNSLVDTAV